MVSHFTETRVFKFRQCHSFAIAGHSSDCPGNVPVEMPYFGYKSLAFSAYICPYYEVERLS
jgi:hypothetical protein